MKLPLVGCDRMISSILDSCCNPTPEALVRVYTPSLRVWTVDQTHGESNFELDHCPESSERDVLMDFEAPDVIRGRDRDFDDNHAIDGVPVMRIRWWVDYYRRQKAWIVLLSFRTWSLYELPVGDAPQTITESVGGVGKNVA